MKRIFRFDYLLCLLAIPMLIFSFSKMAEFFVSTVNIDISGAITYIGIVLAEILIILFRSKISSYFLSETGNKTLIFTLIFSFICVFLAKPVFLRGCINGGNLTCAVGAALFFCAFLTLLLKTLSIC